MLFGIVNYLQASSLMAQSNNGTQSQKKIIGLAVLKQHTSLAQMALSNCNMLTLWLISHLVLAYLLYRYPNAKWLYSIPIAVYGFITLYLAGVAIYLIH
jgi:hypothetical protein